MQLQGAGVQKASQSIDKSQLPKKGPIDNASTRPDRCLSLSLSLSRCRAWLLAVSQRRPLDVFLSHFTSIRFKFALQFLGPRLWRAAVVSLWYFSGPVLNCSLCNVRLKSLT